MGLVPDSNVNMDLSLERNRWPNALQNTGRRGFLFRRPDLQYISSLLAPQQAYISPNLPSRTEIAQ